MKLALLGNCSYQALIDDQAKIRWLCWPRFDSSFVFGDLLDPEAGAFEISSTGCQPAEQKYVTNTNIVCTRFEGDAGSFEIHDFAPRFQQYERTYRPLMLIRRITPISGTPRISVKCDPTYDYGRLRPRRYQASNHIQWEVPDGNLRLTTNIPLNYVDESREFVLDKTAYLVMTWGEPLQAGIEETCERFFGRTQKYWETWVKHTTLPGEFQSEVIRSALALKLHQYEDTGAITAATTTSLPEYPGSERTWDYRYCWLRDACFTLGALKRLGHFEETERFIGYLQNLVHANDGVLQPVYGISGERILTETILEHLEGFEGNGPVRIGNGAYSQPQFDVYGEMLASLGSNLLDIRFTDVARSCPPELVSGLLDQIETNFDVPDKGLWEKRAPSTTHTFTLLMHWVGAKVARIIGQQTGDRKLGKRGQELETRARAMINDACFRPELGMYADAVTGDHADASTVMLINTGFLDDDLKRAQTHLDALAERLKAGDHLLYRYKHNDGLGDTHATFTICGLWYAEALARVGQVSKGRETLNGMLKYANHVGLFSEDIDPKNGKQWGNFPQTYSHVGVINAAFAISPPVFGFFGPQQ